MVKVSQVFKIFFSRFTWARAFLDMLKEVHDMAGQHEVIAENTQGQLIGELQKCVGELKTDRRKV
jgi:hypothetical protein